MKILIQMKTISTQTKIESQPNPLTNSASTCSKRCSLPCSWPIFIFAAVIFLLYLLYCPHNTTSKKNALRIYSSLGPLLRSADLRILKLAKQFVKQIQSYLLLQPKTPKRHIPIFAMQFASQRYRKGIIAKVSQIVLFDWRGRVLTNVALRPGMPPCPSLWVVFGTSFTRSAALRNFNGGSPTSSTTDWHSASFSSSAFRSRLDLPNSLAFLALASYSVISFSCLATFSYTSDW